MNMRGFDIKRARLAQRKIAERVVEKDELPEQLRIVAGVDAAYRKGMVIGVAVSVDADTLRIIDSTRVILKAVFPYIPTLLAFREAGPAILAVKKLSSRPDLLFVDGNGRLHPFLAGLACQVGLALNVPTIGVAKRLLCGAVGRWRGGTAPIFLENRLVGMAVKIGGYKNPIYVSVGHKISLNTAVRLAKRFAVQYRLPEPLRLAHVEATRTARTLNATLG